MNSADKHKTYTLSPHGEFKLKLRDKKVRESIMKKLSSFRDLKILRHDE